MISSDFVTASARMLLNDVDKFQLATHMEMEYLQISFAFRVIS